MKIKTDSRGIEYVENGNLDELPAGWALCGTCGRAWNDAKPTGWTPAPSARCPFENDHEDEDEEPPTFAVETDKDYHRVQADGEDIVSVQDHGDGTAYVIVYTSDAAGGVAWEGAVRT